MDSKAIEAHQQFQQWMQSISFPQREGDDEAKQNSEAETMRLTDNEWMRHFETEFQRQIEEVEKRINEWESDDNDYDTEEEKSLEETATQYYDDYGEEEFSCSSSEPGTEFDDDDDDVDDDNSNLSFTSEWTLHDEGDRALYNELHKLEEEIKELTTMYEADPEGNKHMRAFFRNCNLNKKRAAAEMLSITPS